MQCPEIDLYNKIKEKKDNEIFLFLVSEPYQLKHCVLPIKNIVFYVPESYNYDNNDIALDFTFYENNMKKLKQYIDEYDTVYLLNELFYYSTKKINCEKIIKLPLINFVKYISMFPNEIDVMDNNENNNKYLYDKLLSDYKTSLFYCFDNTYIAGIDGFLLFSEHYYGKYLNTINKIYIVKLKTPKSMINNSIQQLLYTHNNIEIIDNIDVYNFYKNYPNMIAFYRAQYSPTHFYLNKHYNFEYIAKITENIFLGNENYKHYNNYFYENNVYDIIDVRGTKVNNYMITFDSLEDTIVHKFPVTEPMKETLPIECEQNFFDAVEKLNELVAQKKNVYIHCMAGVNRSPAVICVWLMKYQNFTLYEAYVKLAQLRYIWTAPSMFDVVYKYAKELNKDDISPLKITNHGEFINHFIETKFVFALYDCIHLDSVKKCVK
jgi:hypothetical protein